MELWTAFVVGIAGSLHCVGMCGPIALALPTGGRTGFWQLLPGRLLYNLGRITTYSIFGLLFGVFGKGLALTGMQQGISIALGVLLLVMALSYGRTEQWINKVTGINKYSFKLKEALGKHLKIGSDRSLYTIGLLNGLLPCGFLYFGIIGAISTGSALQGAAYMALFGAGTLPLMLGTAMAGSFLSVRWRGLARKLTPAIAVVFAVLFIMRGLDLGIPYVSPKLGNGTEMHKMKCH